MKKKEGEDDGCLSTIRAANDALYVISGKWKILIVRSLGKGPMRFGDLEKSIENITPKVLSKELKELELNRLVEKKENDGFPVQTVYMLTPYSDSFRKMVRSLAEWGKQHREVIMRKGD